MTKAAALLERHGDRLRAAVAEDPSLGGRRLQRLLTAWDGAPVSRRQVMRVLDAIGHRGQGGGRPAETGNRPAAAEQVCTQGTDDAQVVEATSRSIRTLDDLLAAAEVDLAVWRVVKFTANAWEQAQKGPDGAVRHVQLHQVKAHLERRHLDGVRPARPVPRRPSKATPGGERAVFIPDAQVGFRWSLDFQRLEPMHDRAAMDAAVQVVAAVRPSVVVVLGDMLDLAPWSTKFPRPPELRQTTQPAVDELHWWLTEIADAAPRAHLVYVMGNHEDRIDRALNEAIPEASRLRPAGEEEPALSVARLLQLDALGYEVVGPYGAEWWLWDRVRVHHGEVVRRGGGATAAAVVRAATHSEVFGHVHRVETAQRTLHGPGGRRVVTAMSPGSLCRVDGSVPGVSTRPDWQQGVGVAVQDETGHDHLVALPIVDGRVAWAGEVLQGAERVDEIAAATGWRQLAR